MKQVNKQLYLQHFKNDWLYYLVGLIISVIFWVMMFSLKFPKYSNQSINVFVSGQLTNHHFVEEFELHFDNTIDINIVSVDTTNEGYYDKLSLVGLNSCEVIILPKSVADNLPLKNYMHQLTNDFINTNFSNLNYEYFYQGDIRYGLKIESTRMDWLNQSFVSSEDDYYLFINDIAVDEDNYIDNNIIEVLQYLLGD